MLKEQASERCVIGIELDPGAGQSAQSRLDKVYQGNVQETLLDEPPASFDCLIYGDVLEHLVEPLKVLQRHRPLLREGGHIVVSVPNVQFYYVLWSLLRGRWTYTDRGIFDRSHLRFFTLREIQRLLSDAGYRIVSVKHNYRLLERPSRINRAAACIAWLPLLRPFLTYQYLLMAQKAKVAAA
jgi:2-polyprenyl-3-methyl-5-hydroxy-6-metoxy-1,4-benzoquinol methylase